MSTPARPPQATMAAALVIGGSVLLVLAVFQQVADLRSLENREAVATFLSEPPGEGLGLSVEEVLTILRVVAMVAAGCATAMAVLGVQALRRSRSARVGLSVLAVPLMITGFLAGGFLAPVVCVAVVMLWLQPSRDWFDGRTPPPRPTPTAPEPPAERPTTLPAAPPSHEPRPYAGFGSPTPAPLPYAGAPVPARGPAPAATPRPAAVLWACALTWVGTGLVAVGMVLIGVWVAVTPDAVMDTLREQDPARAEEVTEDLLVGAVIAMVLLVVVWCVAAAVVAWFAFRRATWAQVLLAVSAGCAGLICLVMVLLGGFLLIAVMAACSVSVALLLRPESRAWYAGRGSI